MFQIVAIFHNILQGSVAKPLRYGALLKFTNEPISARLLKIG